MQRRIEAGSSAPERVRRAHLCRLLKTVRTESPIILYTGAPWEQTAMCSVPRTSDIIRVCPRPRFRSGRLPAFPSAPLSSNLCYHKSWRQTLHARSTAEASEVPWDKNAHGRPQEHEDDCQHGKLPTALPWMHELAWPLTAGRQWMTSTPSLNTVQI